MHEAHGSASQTIDSSGPTSPEDRTTADRSGSCPSRVPGPHRCGRPEDYRELFKRTCGPVVATYERLADGPERTAALDRDFLEFATRANSGPPEGPAEYPYEDLLVVARRRAA